MKAANNLPTSFVVVVLGSIWVGPQFIKEDTVLEVERAVRNDWIGSKLARDATDEEVAAYRADQDDGFDDSLETDRRELIAEIKAAVSQQRALEAELEALQDRKNELAGDLQALESDVAELGKQKDTLTGEIAELEKAKAAAEKPVTAAKATAK